MAEATSLNNNNNRAAYEKSDLPLHPKIPKETWKNLSTVGDLKIFHNNGIRTQYEDKLETYEAVAIISAVFASALILTSILAIAAITSHPALNLGDLYTSVSIAGTGVILYAIAVIFGYKMRQLMKQKLTIQDFEALKTAVTEDWEATQKRLLAVEQYYREQSQLLADLSKQCQEEREQLVKTKDAS